MAAESEAVRPTPAEERAVFRSVSEVTVAALVVELKAEATAPMVMVAAVPALLVKVRTAPESLLAVPPPVRSAVVATPVAAVAPTTSVLALVV